MKARVYDNLGKDRTRPDGGKADAGDLKSPGGIPHVGSNPSPGTNFPENKLRLMVGHVLTSHPGSAMVPLLPPPRLLAIVKPTRYNGIQSFPDVLHDQAKPKGVGDGGTSVIRKIGGEDFLQGVQADPAAFPDGGG